MAALTLVAGFVLVGTPTPAEDKTPVRSTINLQLQITGLSADGTVVEIKPGHPGCKFNKLKKTIQHADNVVRLAGSVVAESTGADRHCAFLITIKEPGQPPKEFRRGIQLAAKTEAKKKSEDPQTLKIYLTAPSVAAKDSAKAHPH
jgi:hypothetical protein